MYHFKSNKLKRWTVIYQGHVEKTSIIIMANHLAVDIFLLLLCKHRKKDSHAPLYFIPLCQTLNM